MNNEKQKIAVKQIKAITNTGIIVNIILFVIKVVVGFLSGSAALVADGIHSLTDMTTDLIVLLGVHFGLKEPDQKHPYGHGRIETFSAGLIALLLAFVGLGMIYYAAADISKGNVEKVGVSVLIVAIISIVVKEILSRLTRKVAVKLHSSSLYANAWHHRSDALSSIVVVLGFISLKMGFEYGDRIATIGIGFMIILVAVQIISDCLSELTEGAIDKDTIGLIEKIIKANTSIKQWHKLRTRQVGREVFLDLHILVDPGLNITVAHDIAENLENALNDKITRPVNITVHIEPDTPELRKLNTQNNILRI